MIPPRGFETEKYPLRHRLAFSASLGASVDTNNTVFLPIVMNSTDTTTGPVGIFTNPHNSLYVEDNGPQVHPMSIIDKMRISLKFNLTNEAADRQETASGVWTGEAIHALHLLWRPIFGSFREKLDAIDDDTTNTVAAILGLTVDSTFEDVVPITTNKLSVTGPSDKALPVSTAYNVQVFGDFNMTTDTTMEDHVWDEDLFQSGLRRFTNKGALRSMVGRTRHLTLTRERPFQNVYMDKFVPRAIRRIVPFSFFGIQVHVPIMADVEQTYTATNLAGSALLGIKCLVNYHEWNFEHTQDRGTPT